MKIQDAIEGYLLDRQPHCSEDTMRWYKQKLNRWHRSMGEHGVVDIEQITVGHLRSFTVEIQKTIADAENPYKPSDKEGKLLSSQTVHGYAQVVKGFCRWLYLEELLEKDPSARLAMPKVEKYLVEPFTLQHLEDMLHACNTTTPLGFRNYAMIMLMADTGLRLGELVRLRVANFYQVNSQGKSHIKVYGKGRKQREIGVSPQVAKLLWKYIHVYRKPSNADEQRFFIGRYGEPLSKRGVENVVECIRDEAGISNVRCSPHTFRHTFATGYIELGGDVHKLSRELGHSKVHVTEEYLKTLPLSVSRQGHESFSVVSKLKGTSRRRSKDAS